MLSGGHAENALPQSATAVVNCRVLPVDKLDDVARTLNQVLADSKIQLSVMTAGRPVPAYVPTNPKVMGVVTAATAKRWPGLAVIPQMSSGASDGIYLAVRLRPGRRPILRLV